MTKDNKENNSNNKIVQYDFHLPIWKQGDDLAHNVSENGNDPVKGLIGLAEQYEYAASLCRKVAGKLVEAENKEDIEVDGDTHSCWVIAPANLVSSLVEEGILNKQNCFECGEEECEGECLDENFECDDMDCDCHDIE